MHMDIKESVGCRHTVHTTYTYYIHLLHTIHTYYTIYTIYNCAYLDSGTATTVIQREPLYLPGERLAEKESGKDLIRHDDADMAYSTASH